jgi:hypothetical protein
MLQTHSSPSSAPKVGLVMGSLWNDTTFWMDSLMHFKFDTFTPLASDPKTLSSWTWCLNASGVQSNSRISSSEIKLPFESSWSVILDDLVRQSMSHSLKSESSVPRLGWGGDKAWNITRHFTKFHPWRSNPGFPNCESHEKIDLEELNWTNLYFAAMAPPCSPR